MFAKQIERKNMLIYNTTYQVEEGQEDNPDLDKGILFTRSRENRCIAYAAYCPCTEPS